jgi:hypothetical protein
MIRTGNAPAGDYAAHLMMTALGGQLPHNSEKSWDLLANGKKLQVKARVVSDPARPGQLQLSPFRSFGFDSAVIVLLSAADYTVVRASKVPRHVIETSATYRKHARHHGNQLRQRALWELRGSWTGCGWLRGVL